MTDAERSLQHHAALDARLVAAVRGIRLLESVSWPAQAQEEFLAAWKIGRIHLPKIEYPRGDYDAIRAELEAVDQAADPDDPLGRYLLLTSESWRIATRLLDAVGTHRVTAYSSRLFGRPMETLPGDGPTHLDAAQHFIGLANEMDQELREVEPDYVLPAETVQLELQTAIDAFFTQHKVRVELDPNLISKAAASSDPHPPAHQHRLLRIRPQPAAGARGLRAFADRAQRPRAAALQVDGARLAAHHGHAGRAGDVRRTDLGLDGHRAHEAHQPAHRRHRQGHPRRRFRRRVPLLHRFGAEPARQLHLQPARVPRRAAGRRRGVHQGHRVPARPAVGAHLFPLVPAPPQAGRRRGSCSRARWRWRTCSRWRARSNRARSPRRCTCRRGCSARTGWPGMLAFSLFANKIRLDRVDADDLVLGL